jgi:hypothetical protein
MRERCSYREVLPTSNHDGGTRLRHSIKVPAGDRRLCEVKQRGQRQSCPLSECSRTCSPLAYLADQSRGVAKHFTGGYDRVEIVICSSLSRCIRQER